MKILFLANNDVGLYQFRRELVEALLKENTVILALPYGDRVDELRRMGCSFIDTPINRRGTNPIEDLKLLASYKRLLGEVRPDIVFTYTIKPNIYGGAACAALGIPYVANITGLGTAVENGGILQTVTLNLYKFGLRRAQRVFFQNAANQDFMLCHNVIRSPYSLLPGSGVCLNAHPPQPYPNDKDGIRFLFVGRIMKDKGIEELLKAIAALHDENASISLDIVGGYEEAYSEMLQHAEASGTIRYHGAQKDVRPFYMNCHCTVLPSYHEGMSNVLLEASASGRPIIATRVPGCQETFDEGITGLGCEAKDTESLIKAMRTFLALTNEQREEMGIHAREKMKKEFDRTIVIQAYEQELEKSNKSH